MESDKFAYIKYVEDRVTAVIPIEDIKKFNVEEHNPARKYKAKFTDGHYYKAFVISVGRTKEEAIEKAEARRIRLPNSKLTIDSQDDDSTADSEGEHDNAEIRPSVDNKKKSKTVNNNEIMIENYQNLLKDLNNREEENNEESEKENSPPVFQVPNIPKIKVLKPNNPEINSLKLEIQELKTKESKLMLEMQQLRQLNFKLQEDVINKFKDLTTLSKMPELLSEQDIPVGQRKDNQIHLGRGIWLPVTIYDSASSRSIKKDSLFIKEIALAVFGEHVLKISSVTGSISNRTKGEAKQPLDPTKLMAIHDIVRYRLESHGAPREKVEETLRSINSRIAEKIYDLTRPPKRKQQEQDELIALIEEASVEVQEDLNNGN